MNPAKVEDIQPLDLIQRSELVFDRTLNHEDYCTFHQVFGVAGVSEAPSLRVAGRYKSRDDKAWNNFDLTSVVAYGENTTTSMSTDSDTIFDMTYRLSGIFDDIDFDIEQPDNDIAKQVFKNVIRQAVISISERYPPAVRPWVLCPSQRLRSVIVKAS